MYKLLTSSVVAVVAAVGFSTVSHAAGDATVVVKSETTTTPTSAVGTASTSSKLTHDKKKKVIKKSTDRKIQGKLTGKHKDKKGNTHENSVGLYGDKDGKTPCRMMIETSFAYGAGGVSGFDGFMDTFDPNNPKETEQLGKDLQAYFVDMKENAEDLNALQINFKLGDNMPDGKSNGCFVIAENMLNGKSKKVVTHIAEFSFSNSDNRVKDGKLSIRGKSDMHIIIDPKELTVMFLNSLHNPTDKKTKGIATGTVQAKK